MVGTVCNGRCFNYIIGVSVILHDIYVYIHYITLYIHYICMHVYIPDVCRPISVGLVYNGMTSGIDGSRMPNISVYMSIYIYIY